jgi:tRNA nucleotidyltransferase (CCA-adding enzyme)
MEIFSNAILPKEKYGSVTLHYKDIRFEITTFRKEIVYENRKPIEIEYSRSFVDDINRRDFTINSLCMNKDGIIIDILNGKEDIKRKVIKTIGNSDIKFIEDPLRILRAIRFATQLDFKLDKELIDSIKMRGNLVKNLSYNRKKDELNKIFSSTNIRYGLKLLENLNLNKYLELNDINKIKITSDVLGIWAQLGVVDIYPFSKLEKGTINTINKICKNKKITRYELYNYGLYNVSIAAEILGISKKIITKLDAQLNIHSKKDININADEICNLLNKEPGKRLKDIYNDLELKILYSKLENNKDKIKNYIVKNY